MLSLLLIAPLVAAPVPPEPDPAPRYERLENGLRVIVVEDHARPLISVQLWFAAGSALDPPDRIGLCHVVRALLEPQGAGVPAALPSESRTLRDACYFAQVVSSAAAGASLNGALAACAGVFSRAADEERMRTALARARASSEANILAVDGVPADQIAAWRKLLERAFADAGAERHPYRIPPGLVGDWAWSPDRDEVDAFRSRWFVPAMATILIIGDVSASAAREAVRVHLGGLARVDPPRKPEVPFFRDPPMTVVPDVSSGVVVTWFTPPAGDVLNVSFDVLAARMLNGVDGILRGAPPGTPDARMPASDSAPIGYRRLAWREMGLCVLALAAEPMPASAASDAAALEGVDQRLRRAEERLARGDNAEVSLNRARALAYRAGLERRSGFIPRARKLGEAQLVVGDLLADEFERDSPRRVGIADLRAALGELRRAADACMRRKVRPGAIDGVVELAAGGVFDPAALEEFVGPAGITGSGGRIACSFHRSAGEPLALVRAGCARWRDAGALRNTVARGFEGWDGARLADYLSYRGLALRVTVSGDAAELELTGPRGELAPMVELGRRLSESLAGAGATIRLLVVADALPETVFSAVFGESAEATTPSSD